MSETIGEILQKTRKERKLAIADIAKATHIRPKYIEALESNQFDLLPSVVQGRGFLRSYANFLELPAEILLNNWKSGIVATGAITQDTSGEEAVITEEDSSLIQADPSQFPGEEETIAIKDSKQPTIDIQSLEEESTAQNIFRSIGSSLRDQREMLDLSLNDIEQYTHIRQFYLQAIEAGRMKDLPSPVQAKGMIENYAQFLDMNSDALMLKYAEALQVQREEKLAAISSPSKKQKKLRRPDKQSLAKKLITPDLLIGSIVIISLVVFAVWSTSRVIARRNQAALATIPGISDVLAVTSSSNIGALPGETKQEFTGTDSPVPSPEFTPEITAPTIPTENYVAPSLEGDVSPSPAIIDNAPLQVYIVSRQRAYLKVIVDSITEFDGRVLPGNAYPFSGSESIEVLTGNAAALQIFFNQVDLGTIGGFGQVVDLIFLEQGFVTPTARFTASPSATLPPTVTLEPTPTIETPTVTPIIP